MTNQKTIQPESQEISKAYEPKLFEKKWYKFWEENGCFNASDKNAAGQKSFSISIPPPNVTGVLHIGHALTNTIQDVLIRWHRMKGDNTLWLPGTDHAGISTQVQVEKAIAKEGKGVSGKPLTRYDLGREKFLERTWQWKNEHHGRITQQVKSLGCSLDWSRERFTLDEGLSSAVKEVFVSLYKDGLIYRGLRMINWCTVTQTAISDLEVVSTETKGKLYHIRYPVVESSGEAINDNSNNEVFLTIATTRPETLLGDTAVAIHPDDERYKKLHGKYVKLPLVNRILPIICDEYVEQEFGTGALKITPAHDFNDYDLGIKHKLEIITVIGKDGQITSDGGVDYQGLKIKQAREKIVEDLTQKSFLTKIEDYTHKVGISERGGLPAEPLLSEQWFVKIKPLAEPAMKAVRDGEIKFSPESWEKVYFDWMNNIEDWCISRQLWWGHQIPAWHCLDCSKITVEKTIPSKCESCGSTQIKQDEDVLDTWFSSALWPFSTLGWPEKTKALETFYPNSIMETGWDIIFFWVARMIMMGTYFMKEVPFKRVCLHPLIMDEHGEKMSKSKGNVLDPMQVIDEQGADALRFTLLIASGQSRYLKLAKDRIESSSGFCNKIWNAVKYFHFQVERYGLPEEPKECLDSWVQSNFKDLSLEHKWILSRLQNTIETVENGYEAFELNHASTALYDFIWKELCDWYVELSKSSFQSEKKEQEKAFYVFRYVIDQSLRLMHPIMPFVTEELWQTLPWKSSAQTSFQKESGLPGVVTLMLQKFPVKNELLISKEAEAEFEMLKNIVDIIRVFKGENKINPKKELHVKFFSEKKDSLKFIEKFNSEIKMLATLTTLKATSGALGQSETALFLKNPECELRVDMSGLVDIEEEIKRIEKEISKNKIDQEKINKKFENPSFLKKAPPALIKTEQAKINELKDLLLDLEGSLKKFIELQGKK